MRRWVALAIFIASTTSVAFADDEKQSSLGQILLPLIKAHTGEVAVAVKHLKTGESFAYRGDEPMPTASLIKLAVMIEAYRQASEKQIDLAAPITLRKEDKVPGSGILNYHFSAGTTFPLRDAIHLMIYTSDNTATNLVLDKIGIASTGETMEKLGYPNTKIHSKVFRRDTTINRERSKRFGLGSTTANEMIGLCERIYKKELVSVSCCEEMLAQLRSCDDKDKFPRFLPTGTPIAFKTGSVDDIRTAAGIIEGPRGPIALCVLTEKNQDKRYAPDNEGNLLCAKVAQAVFEHFASLEKPNTKENK